LDYEKEVNDSLSSFNKQVTDLYGKRDRLRQKLIDESSETTA